MRVALLASVLVFAGCDVGEVPIGGGGVDGGGGADPMASATFTANIKPMLEAAGCTTGGATGLCHGNVQSPIMTSFEALSGTPLGKSYVSKPGSASKFVTGPLTIDPTSGKHPTSQPAMAVVYLDQTKKDMIKAWIDMYGF